MQQASRPNLSSHQEDMEDGYLQPQHSQHQGKRHDVSREGLDSGLGTSDTDLSHIHPEISMHPNSFTSNNSMSKQNRNNELMAASNPSHPTQLVDIRPTHIHQVPMPSQGAAHIAPHQGAQVSPHQGAHPGVSPTAGHFPAAPQAYLSRAPRSPTHNAGHDQKPLQYDYAQSTRFSVARPDGHEYEELPLKKQKNMRYDRDSGRYVLDLTDSRNIPAPPPLEKIPSMNNLADDTDTDSMSKVEIVSNNNTAVFRKRDNPLYDKSVDSMDQSDQRRLVKPAEPSSPRESERRCCMWSIVFIIAVLGVAALLVAVLSFMGVTSKEQTPGPARASALIGANGTSVDSSVLKDLMDEVKKLRRDFVELQSKYTAVVYKGPSGAGNLTACFQKEYAQRATPSTKEVETRSYPQGADLTKYVVTGGTCSNSVGYPVTARFEATHVQPLIVQYRCLCTVPDNINLPPSAWSCDIHLWMCPRIS